MNVQRRRIVAFIASNLVRPSRDGAVYDVEPPHKTALTGEVSPNLIAVYDHDRQDYVLGHRQTPESVRLTDLATQHGIDLNLLQGQFSGLDHETGKKFCGEIKENLILFYDEADQQTYQYRV